MIRTFTSLTVISLVVACSGTSAQAAFLAEPFNTNSTNLAVDYPAYHVTGAGTAAVVSQQLNLQSAGGGAVRSFETNATFAPFADLHVLATSIGGVAGNHNVGVFLGTGDASTLGPNDNQIIFHPGFATGALRVLGPGGFGNQNVGFTPAQGVLHPLSIHHDGAGNFTVTLTNGGNLAQSFTIGWTNTALAAAPFQVGLVTQEAFGGTPTAIFDYLVVPEPSMSLAWMGCASVMIGRIRRTRHADPV